MHKYGGVEPLIQEVLLYVGASRNIVWFSMNLFANYVGKKVFGQKQKFISILCDIAVVNDKDQTCSITLHKIFTN